MTLIESNDPETKLKWLFTLCDLDRDGLVNQADVTEVLTILMIFGSADPTSAQPDETTVEQTKNEIGKRCKESVENIFADKAPLNTEQFRQGFEEREANFFDELVRLLSACFVDAVI